MDDLWVRVAFVAGALGVAGAFALWQQRRRASRPERSVEVTGLDAGVYFFSSSECPTCAGARRKLEARLAGQYTEVTWESSPGIFAYLDVDAVPSIVLVGEDGKGRVFTGRLERALRRV